MEDKYGILLEDQNIFLDILGSAEILSKSSIDDIKDSAILFIEYMNEFYMNYPLRGQSMSVLGSAFDEMEFLSLHDSSPVSYNKNVRKLNSLSYCKPVRSWGIDIKLTHTT